MKKTFTHFICLGLKALPMKIGKGSGGPLRVIATIRKD